MVEIEIFVHVNCIRRRIQPQRADPAAPTEKVGNGVHLKFATLFSQKIQQSRLLLDMFDGFSVHKIDCNIRLEDESVIKGSSVIYCIVIDTCMTRPVNVTALMVQSTASY